MNTVTVLTHSVDKSHILRLFAKFRSRYGQLWTSRANTDADWEFIIDDWLSELSKFTLGELYKAVRYALDIHTKYPPTLGELLELCLKANGVPDISQVIRMMINKDFSHPVARLIHEKIGSWKLSNGTEREIEEKTSSFYQQAVIDFKENPEKAWAQLNSYKENLALSAPEPTKIPSPSESKCFSERMAEYQKQLSEAKNSCAGESYRHFDEALISPTRNTFDPKVYEEFKKYILSIPDNKTMILPTNYIYRRMRFIAQREQSELLRQFGFNSNGKEDISGNNKKYKTWNN